MLEKKGEKDHPFKRIAKMKIITCLYVERKIAHEGYVISA
jgi:hypothetical protein